MKYERWVGSHNWKRSTDIIDGYPSRNERSQTDTQDLDDLINWLEYNHTGYSAMRQSVDQEEYWAKLIRNLLCEKTIQNLVFFGDNTFKCKCIYCNHVMKGTIYIPEKDCVQKTTVTIGMLCDCLKEREPDLLQYIKDKIGDWY